MLLIDGVRYKEWTDLKETEDLEPMVIEHAKEIFGTQSEYFNIKRQLEACLGRRTIPDGYVVDFSESPQWHVVEVELSSHPVDKHIREQVNDFITAMEKTVSTNRHKIIDEINIIIKSNDLLRYRIEKLIKPKEIYEFLTNLILYKPPILTIIIEKESGTLKEELYASLRYSPMKIVEFRTFRREGAESVHAHIFEPLYKPLLPSPVGVEQQYNLKPGDKDLDGWTLLRRESLGGKLYDIWESKGKRRYDIFAPERDEWTGKGWEVWGREEGKDGVISKYYSLEEAQKKFEEMKQELEKMSR